MTHKIYNKLVRDKILEIIKASGGVPKAVILDSTALKEALIKKLGEETDEFSEARTPEELLGELTDLQEVVDALTKLSGFTLAERNQAQISKRNERGGFEQGIFLESVTEPEVG